MYYVISVPRIKSFFCILWLCLFCKIRNGQFTLSFYRIFFLQTSCFWPYKRSPLYMFIIFKKKKKTKIIFFFHFNRYFTQGTNIPILTKLSHFFNSINKIEPLWKKEDVCSSVSIFYRILMLTFVFICLLNIGNYNITC